MIPTKTPHSVKTEYPWHFIPKSSQEWAYISRADHILSTGTRGPGKTDTQLYRFRRRVGIGYGQFWTGVIFDKEYKNLDDLIKKSKRWFKQYNDGAEFLASASALKWRWPTGEELLFRIAKDIDDYWDYHGHEYPFIGWNELTKYASPELYEKMMSTNRSSFTPERDTPYDTFDSPPKDLPAHKQADGSYRVYKSPIKGPNGETIYYQEPLPKIPLEVFSTTNPYGAGHNWVKRQFINVAPYGVEVEKKTIVFDPKTKKDVEVTKRQVAIFGHYSENPFLSPEYIADLVNIKDPNLKAAWERGSWDITAGGALDDLWSRDKHIIPHSPIPENWYVNRAFDWGSSHPFAVGWFAEANGEEWTLSDGRTICPPAGTLIMIADLYGSNYEDIGKNKGLKWSAKKVAEAILEKEQWLYDNGYIFDEPDAGPADNQISNVTERDTETIEKKMQDVGVYWEKSDKSKGSRKIGLQLIRDRLEAVIDGEGPGLLFMDNCRASIETIPVLPRSDKDPDDVDTDAEDHAYDLVRYRVLQGNDRSAKVIRVKFG
jgi:hypothetical protein